MSRRQEICRDFQRGNCRYGANCKYLHVLPQQQQQRSNQQQSKNQYGGRENYYSPLSTSNNSNSNRRQPQNQPQSPAKDHRCNDPRICKDLIKEDFANERPSFWRLTCYAHYKFLPNDIVGDVSPEELRAIAYEGAKQGLSLKDVAQREAAMVAAKNAEFEALLRNPYKGPAPQRSSFLTASPILTPPQAPGAPIAFGQQASFPTPPASQGFAQPAFGGTSAGSFSFGQPSGRFGIGTPSSTVPNQSANAQQANPFQSNPFGSSLAQTPPPQNFIQPVVAPTLPQISPVQGFGGPSPSTQSPFPSLQGSNVSFNTNASQPPAFHTFNQGFGSFTNFRTPPNASAAPTGPASVSHTTPATPLPDAVTTKAQHNAIWFKDVWKVGEIPEEEPPPEVRR